jgi:glutamine synthetase
VMLKAGMEGIAEKRVSMEPLMENVYHFTEAELDKRNVETLPEHLGDAIDEFVKDPLVTDALGGYISKNLAKLKRREFEDYMAFTGQIWAKSRLKITQWEIDRYLTRC